VSLPYRTLVKLLASVALFQSTGCSDGGSTAGPNGKPTSAANASDAGNSPPIYASPAVDAGTVASESDAGLVADAGVADAVFAADANPPIQIESTGGGSVVSIDVTPLALTPAFAPSVYDYYVTCSAGTNALTLSVTYTGESLSASVSVLENQAIVVDGQYWIRCLPHDFPTMTVTQHPSVGSPTPGYYLVNSGTYAMVLDTNGTPVWYSQGTATFNVDSPGPDTISFMPNATGPFGTSEQSYFGLNVLDRATVTDVVAADGPTDVHELQALPNGDHLVFMYFTETGVDLTGLQTYGQGENMADCKIEEVSPTGSLVWSWLASDHIDPVRESIEPALDVIGGMNVVDVFHCNSIDVDSQGNLLMSSRHANAAFYIDRSTGTIQWKLGGTEYNKDGAAYIDVQNDPETTFSMQHDVRFQPNGDVSMFDDHGAGPGVARGVEYALDFSTNTATPVWSYLGTAQSQYEGSCRRYADGESVVGWGYITTDPRAFTEVNANGDDVLDVAFGEENVSYRAVKVPVSQLDIQVLRETTAP
jgi:hypothetical protein